MKTKSDALSRTLFDYENFDYFKKLGQLRPASYEKYLKYIQLYLAHKREKFLDVGCGNGFVLKMLKSVGYHELYGIDISKLFVQELRKEKMKHVYSYNGVSMPFKDNFFNVVGSFNVLEHTGNPVRFLREQIRVLRPGGYIIVGCPNFLTAIMKSPHPQIAGIVQKIRNMSVMVGKLIKRDCAFDKMPIIRRASFDYDDDAVIITNLLNVKHALRSNGCDIVFESGFIELDSLLCRVIDAVPLAKYFMPSCFVVARKSR